MKFVPKGNNMSRMNKARAAAEQLYLAGFTQAEIARVIKVSENTVSKWSTQMRWGEKRVRQNLLEENSIQKLMDIFEFQVECLHKDMTEQRKKGEMTPFAPGQFDALQKLFTTIKPDFKKFGTYIKVVKDFIDFVQSEDIALAKKLVAISDKYINEKKKLI